MLPDKHDFRAKRWYQDKVSKLSDQKAERSLRQEGAELGRYQSFQYPSFALTFFISSVFSQRVPVPSTTEQG